MDILERDSSSEVIKARLLVMLLRDQAMMIENGKRMREILRAFLAFRLFLRIGYSTRLIASFIDES